MKKAILILMAITLAAAIASCQKKEEQPVAKSSVKQGPIIDEISPAPGHGSPEQKTEFNVVVPPEVIETWTGVTIAVDDKQEGKQTDYTVAFGGEFEIPESGLKVKVGSFLPDFKMSGTVITSASADPNNPAVGITVFKDGEKVFPTTGEVGWLYANFPTIHSFQHERYGLILKAGMKKEPAN